MSTLRFLVVALLAVVCSCYRHLPRAFVPAISGSGCSSQVAAGARRGSQLFMSSSGPGGLDDATRDFLDKVVKDNKVVLFMKGTALFPQCGFSNTAVRILDAVGTKFETVNVLESDKIRNGIKVYSSWPTIPQLYVGGEFVGGSDIMIELYQNGQLAEMIELANAN